MPVMLAVRDVEADFVKIRGSLQEFPLRGSKSVQRFCLVKNPQGESRNMLGVGFFDPERLSEVPDAFTPEVVRRGG